jgi:hypothetical protein
LFKTCCTAVAICAASIFLAACSPKLDWRSVQSPQERYTALFPAKPDKLQRQIPFDGQELSQVLEAVKVDDDIYSVSSIKLTSTQVALLPSLMAQLQSNLLDRAKASGGAVEIVNTSYLTVDKQRLSTKDYLITFKSKTGSAQLMRVRWITRAAPNGDMWVYQVSTLHGNESSIDAKTFLSKEEYENFFNEFSPE